MTDAPPHSIDAERSVLGAVLINDAYLNAAVEERLRPADFYREQHAWVFAAMLKLYEANQKVDVITVSAALAEDGKLEDCGGSVAIDALAGYVPAAGHAREYARIVRDLAVRRRLREASFKTIEDATTGTGNVRDLLVEAERRMMSVSDVQADALDRIDPDDELARMEKIRNGVNEVGTPSGFVDVDRMTAGFQPGNLLVLAARPSMGKSALVVNFAERVAKAGHAVALFSLEMSRSEILRRLLASIGKVPGNELLRGPLSEDRWKRICEAAVEVMGYPLFVDESPEVGVLDIRAKARRLHQRHPLGLIIVDYVQLMRGDSSAESRNIEVGRMTRGLKILARELHVPVLAVSQLSRAVEQRQDKRPMLSDLRDSGSVEQDADVVMFLYRDSYYKPDVEDPAVSELNVAKQRNGPTGKILLTFLDRYPKFESHADAATWGAAQQTVPATGSGAPF